MKAFKLSEKLDKNKVFILNKSEVDKRFDPHFYMLDFQKNANRIKRVNYAKLGEIADFSSETWNQQDFFDKTFPYLEISEIDIKTGEINNIAEIEKTQAASRAKMIIRNGDIIISTTRPHRGAISIIEGQKTLLIASTGFSVIRNIKLSNISKKYLLIALRQQFSLMQMMQRSSGGNYPAITQNELNNLLIPIPSKQIQDKVVELMDNVYLQKKQNDAEAEKLLASIDDYLMAELGVKLPPQSASHLKDRIFYTPLSEVSGDRFDPFFHQKYFDIFKNPQSKYPIKKIKEVSDSIKTGLPVRKDYRVEGGNYPYYGANGIIGYMDEYTHNGLYLVIGQDGYIGNHFVVNGKFWGSNHNWVMKLKDGYDYNFIKATLDLFKYEYLVTGGVIPKLTKEALETICIAIPPLAKQTEIANHISKIRQKAQSLKDQTTIALEKANKEIENILLGNKS